MKTILRGFQRMRRTTFQPGDGLTGRSRKVGLSGDWFISSHVSLSWPRATPPLTTQMPKVTEPAEVGAFHAGTFNRTDRTLVQDGCG